MLAALLPLLRPGEAAPPSELTLEPIDAWATDAASGGTISSPGGGTVGVFPVTIDPTPYVTGAVGSKAAWLVQFQGSTRGTWARLANGDFRFTPGPSAGVDAAEYRVSDDGGATWSAWQDIAIEVCARPPGPFFAVEDYPGSDNAKMQSALNAANAVSGTIFARNRSTVFNDIIDLKPGRASLLGIKVKRGTPVHSTGDVCGENVGPGKCDPAGWTGPGLFSVLFDYPAGSSNGYRAQYVLCDLHGNSHFQVLRHQPGNPQHVEPSSPCGTCYGDGDRTSGDDCFSLQQQAAIQMRGAVALGESSRRLLRFKRTRIKDTCGDAVDMSASCDVIADDCAFIDCYRGCLTANGGNSKIVMNRCLAGRDVNGENQGTGIDLEPFNSQGLGEVRCDITATDCDLGEDFDTQYRDGAIGVYTRCNLGPGTQWLGSGGASVTHIDGEIRFHNTGGSEPGSSFPRCRIGKRDSDADFTITFNGARFVAWGLPYTYNREWKTPITNDNYGIQLFDSLTGPVRFINVTCDAAHILGSNPRIRLITSSQPGTYTVRLDNVTFGPMYRLDAVRLNGQRLEYRNVVHQGFPGAGIQQICPGAGQYVAI